MAELVRLTRHDDIAVITIDNPPVNALSPGVAEGIQALLDEAARDGRVRAIVLLGAGQTFIAGADIREFAKIVSGERPRLSLYPFLLAIED
jgi:3-hydroxyacyl-CoA dehydrogenase